MKAALKAVQTLERAADRIRKKLAGTDALRAELDAIHAAIKALRPLADAQAAEVETTPKRGGRRKAAAA